MRELLGDNIFANMEKFEGPSREIIRIMEPGCKQLCCKIIFFNVCTNHVFKATDILRKGYAKGLCLQTRHNFPRYKLNLPK